MCQLTRLLVPGIFLFKFNIYPRICRLRIERFELCWMNANNGVYQSHATQLLKYCAMYQITGTKTIEC